MVCRTGVHVLWYHFRGMKDHINAIALKSPSHRKCGIGVCAIAGNIGCEKKIGIDHEQKIPMDAKNKN